MNTRRYEITPRAKRDLLEIGRFTGKTWGKEQRDRYLKALTDRFDWLAEFPRAGQSFEEVRPNLHAFSEGSHTIFYGLAPDRIEIVRVLHRRMSTEGKI